MYAALNCKLYCFILNMIDLIFPFIFLANYNVDHCNKMSIFLKKEECIKIYLTIFLMFICLCNSIKIEFTMLICSN